MEQAAKDLIASVSNQNIVDIVKERINNSNTLEELDKYLFNSWMFVKEKIEQNKAA